MSYKIENNNAYSQFLINIAGKMEFINETLKELFIKSWGKGSQSQLTPQKYRVAEYPMSILWLVAVDASIALWGNHGDKINAQYASLLLCGRDKTNNVNGKPLTIESYQLKILPLLGKTADKKGLAWIAKQIKDSGGKPALCQQLRNKLIDETIESLKNDPQYTELKKAYVENQIRQLQGDGMIDKALEIKVA